MSEKSWAIRVAHMLQAIDELESFTDGLAYERFCAQPETYRAAERVVEILGEAAKHIPQAVREEFPYSWAAVINMRNLVIHEYHKVNYKVLWDTIRIEIPELKSLLLQIHKKYGKQP